MKKPNRPVSEPIQYSKEDAYLQKINVPFEYPVCFTYDLFDVDNPVFTLMIDRLKEQRRPRVLIYIDAGVAQTHPGLTKKIKAFFHHHTSALELSGAPKIVPGGEAAKNKWDLVQDIIRAIGNLHLCRQSYVTAIGGGSVLDAIGFAASLVHRGLRLIRVPTTVLSQNDAGVGVKNGMNEHGMKNFVGTFAPPFAVINDLSFLPTLEEKDWRGGISEAFKVALIKDAGFFDFLYHHAEKLKQRNMAAMEILVRRCAALHLEHIRTSGDPFEFGAARPLDFGHWAAHKIESLSGYAIGHGQAVAIGIALDTYYAMREHLLTTAEMNKILEGLSRSGLPVWHDLLAARTHDGRLNILEGLEQFREHLGGNLAVTLPDGIGASREVRRMNVNYIEDAVRFLKKRHKRFEASN